MASLDDLRKAIGGPSGPRDTGPLTPEQQAKLDQYIKAGKLHEQAVESSLNSTRKSIEESGYLYHYAPRSARESILSEGLMGSKAVTADVVENGIYFFTNPNDAPSAAGVLSVSGRITQENPEVDLFRVKVEPGMLEDMVIDAKLPIRGDIASAVVVPSRSGSFAAELIGENARFESSGELMDLFSKASYDPLKPLATNPIDNLRFDINGESYFLHYSSADIKVGEKILPSGSPKIKQSGNTGDALFGRSYAFDALDPRSIQNAIINQGVELIRNKGTADQQEFKRVYLTKASTANVAADVNIIASEVQEKGLSRGLSENNFRAILGEQEVLDRIDIPFVRNKDEEPELYKRAKGMVEELLQRHGIVQNTQEDQKLVNIAHSISARTVQDINEYNDARIRTRINDLIGHKFFDTPYMVSKVEKDPSIAPFAQAIREGDAEKAYNLRHLSDIDVLTGKDVFDEAKVKGVISAFKNFEESTGSKVGKTLAQYSRKEMGLAKRTLDSIVSAGETAAKVMRFTL